MVRSRWLFVLSCIALITSAFTFVIRGDVLQPFGDHFGLTQDQKGAVEGAVFLGMAFSMLGGGFICDLLGMKRIMWLAFTSHIVGAGGTILMGYGTSETFGGQAMAFNLLWLLSFLMGCGNGFTEVAINPLVATLYPRDKTHYLNVLHAWWPGGLVIGGILARVVGGGLDLGFVSVAGLGLNWQVSLLMIVIPALIYGCMLIPAKFPATERVEAGISNADMFKACLRPMFFLWAICMLMTAATELGPQKWQESVMMSVTGGNVSGTLILVYTSGMMFVLRHFAGPIAHRLSPTGMLIGSSILAGMGLYLLSFADNTRTAFGFATIFGLGIAYFWPTMLGVTAERFPKGGALALALMGSVGNLSIAFVLPQMGGIVEHYSVNTLEKDSPSLTNEFLVKNDDGQPRALNSEALNTLNAKAVGEIANLLETQPEVFDQIVANPNVAARMREEAAEKEPNFGKVTAQVLAKGALNREEITSLAASNPQVAALNESLSERDQVTAAEAVGFKMAFRWVSVLPAILIVLFTGIVLYDKSQGGYKPELLLSREEEAELMTGGVQGPIE